MVTIDRSTQRKNGKVMVTFSMQASETTEALYLVGWFDEWDESVYRMERLPDGKWAVTLELEPGCEYVYRFRTASGDLLKDPSMPAAPARFGPNTFFCINSPLVH